MRAILIVGAGQSGLQLGLSLLAENYDVTIMSARTPDEIRAGWPTSTQAMFHPALQAERAYGLNLWEDQTPPLNGLHVTLSAPPGQRALDVIAPLDHPAQSTDQRLKMAAWLELAEQRGATVIYNAVTTADLDGLTALRRYDLTIVAAGKGEVSKLFERDAEKSPFDKPQRALALTYVNGMTPRPDHSAVNFNLIPTVGEYFVFPALTNSGPCDIMVLEGIPGGPMDCWKDVDSPQKHLERSKWILDTFLPWEAERCRHVELTDANGILSGAFAPTVRKPIGKLPSGRLVLGLADAVVLNDPITGQGSNNASKAAKVYMDAIVAHGDRPFDAAFMQATFDRYWDYAQYVTGWTNALLQPPPPHVLNIMGSAQAYPALARRIANGFDDPRDFFPWFAVPEEADKYLEQLAA